MQLESSVTLFDDDKVESRFAELQITADGITSEVSRKVGNDEVISRINQSAEAVKIQASKISINGVITAINNDTTTTIDGDKITTGTLSASAVDATSGTFSSALIPNLSADKITTGTISINRIPSEAKNDTYITDISGGGIKIHDAVNMSDYAKITSGGMDVVSNNDTVAKFGSTAIIGKEANGNTRSIIAPDGMKVIHKAWGSGNDSTVVHLGYDETTSAPFCSLGVRYDGEPAGSRSVAEGWYTTASGDYSHAEGKYAQATGEGAHAEGGYGIRSSSTLASGDYSHAEGSNTTASGDYSHSEGNGTSATKDYCHAEGFSTDATETAAHAEGWNAVASGKYSHAQNQWTTAGYEAQTTIGRYNNNKSNTAFEIGKGSAQTPSNAMEVYWTGNVTIAGTLTQSSDKRLKEHLSYLGKDAADFVRSLKPAHFIKDGEHHVGFYAQDVSDADKWDCMTGEMNGYMTLGYTELIAPLVSYCQRLESRIIQLESKLKGE